MNSWSDLPSVLRFRVRRVAQQGVLLRSFGNYPGCCPSARTGWATDGWVPHVRAFTAHQVVLSNRSATYAQRRRFDKALDIVCAFSRARWKSLECRPAKSVWWLWRLAQALLDADKALKLAPGWPRLCACLGTLMRELGSSARQADWLHVGSTVVEQPTHRRWVQK